MDTSRPVHGALILTLGILSVVGFGILTGLPAWIMGNRALDEINAGSGNPAEGEMVAIGRFLGMLTSGICIGAVVVGTCVFGLGALLAGRS